MTFAEEQDVITYVRRILAWETQCNTPGVTQGVHPGLSLLTYHHMRIYLGKVPQTWNSRS
jgi:hypothetical protein